MRYVNCCCDYKGWTDCNGKVTKHICTGKCYYNCSGNSFDRTIYVSSNTCTTTTTTRAPVSKTSGGTKKTNSTTRKTTTTTRKTTTTTKKATTRRTTRINCFPAGTKVMTILGYNNIEKIKVGDMVLSYNEETGLNEFKRVNTLFIHKNVQDELYELKINDEVIKVTGAHRFYIKNNDGYDWIAAKDLNIGDYVKYADNTYHMIDDIKHESVVETVYNIEVQDNHNYYVGNNQILVHNFKPQPK